MRNELSFLPCLFTWLFFDVFIVAPIMLILTPYTVMRYFPARFFHPYIVVETVEYLLFVAFAVPFVVVGQCCEMVVGLNWSASALQDLWTKWYNWNYKPDCIINGEEMFDHTEPDHHEHCVQQNAHNQSRINFTAMCNSIRSYITHFHDFSNFFY